MNKIATTLVVLLMSILVMTSIASPKVMFSCSQIKGAVDSLGRDTIIQIALNRGATMEQVLSVLRKCKL